MKHRSAFLVVLVVLVASAASAQQISRNAVSVFTSDLGYSSSPVMQGWSGGFGIAVDHHFNAHFSTELSIATERHIAGPALVYTPQGSVIEGPHRVSTTPIDLVAAYHFISETRWRPYIGVGQRFVDSEREALFEPEITGGVTYMVRPHFGLRADAKQLVGFRYRSWDPAFKAGLGVSWRF